MSVPFQVRALYEYDSEHSDDLPFTVGQEITVLEVLDAEWYFGSSKNASTGETKEGVFPINFVERIESKPAAVPPVASHAVPAAASASIAAPTAIASAIKASVPPTEDSDEDDWGDAPEDNFEEKEITLKPPTQESNSSQAAEPAHEHVPEPVTLAAPAPVPEPAAASKPVSEPVSEPVSVDAPVHHVDTKITKSIDSDVHSRSVKSPKGPTSPTSPKPKPRVADKDQIETIQSDFKSRMALFNNPKEEVVERKYKPPPTRTSTFGKTFEAKNGEDEGASDQKYKQPARTNTFSRSFEPVQDSSEQPKPKDPAGSEEEEAVPSMSLKERIAMLQQRQEEERQQLEEAEARLRERKQKREALAPQASGTSQKSIPVSHTGGSFASVGTAGSIESSIPEEHTQTVPPIPTGIEEADEVAENHVDSQPRGPPPVPTSIPVEQPEEDAHQTAASPPRSFQAPTGFAFGQPMPSREPVHEDEGQDDEDEGHDDEDEEEARKIALRERMARIAGAGGNVNLGMLMGGHQPSAVRHTKRDTSAMSKDEIEREQARERLDFQQPVSMMGGPASDEILRKLRPAQPEPEETHEHESYHDAEAESIENAEVSAPRIPEAANDATPTLTGVQTTEFSSEDTLSSSTPLPNAVLSSPQPSAPSVPAPVHVQPSVTRPDAPVPGSEPASREVPHSPNAAPPQPVARPAAPPVPTGAKEPLAGLGVTQAPAPTGAPKVPAAGSAPVPIRASAVSFGMDSTRAPPAAPAAPAPPSASKTTSTDRSFSPPPPAVPHAILRRTTLNDFDPHTSSGLATDENLSDEGSMYSSDASPNLRLNRATTFPAAEHARASSPQVRPPIPQFIQQSGVDETAYESDVDTDVATPTKPVAPHIPPSALPPHMASHRAPPPVPGAPQIPTLPIQTSRTTASDFPSVLQPPPPPPPTTAPSVASPPPPPPVTSAPDAAPPIPRAPGAAPPVPSAAPRMPSTAPPVPAGPAPPAAPQVPSAAPPIPSSVPPAPGAAPPVPRSATAPAPPAVSSPPLPGRAPPVPVASPPAPAAPVAPAHAPAPTNSPGAGISGPQHAGDIPLDLHTLWFTHQNGVPPQLDKTRNRYEIENSETTKRGGRTVVSHDVYVVSSDYVQTHISVVFDKASPSSATASFTQQPAPVPDQEKLKAYSQRFGQALLGLAGGTVSSTRESVLSVVGNLKDPHVLPPVGNRFGEVVYENFGNGSVHQVDSIRPGDIATLDEAHFSGHKGPLQRYKKDFADAAYVVSEWDGVKKKLRFAGPQKDSVRLGDLQSGVVRIYRLVGRDYVGWE